MTRRWLAVLAAFVAVRALRVRLSAGSRRRYWHLGLFIAHLHAATGTMVRTENRAVYGARVADVISTHLPLPARVDRVVLRIGANDAGRTPADQFCASLREVCALLPASSIVGDVPEFQSGPRAEEDAELVYRLVMSVVRSIIRWWGCLQVIGASLVPTAGSTLLAANRDSSWDRRLTGVATQDRCQIRTVAKSELWRSQPPASVLDGMGQLRISRGRADRTELARIVWTDRRQAPTGGVRDRTLAAGIGRDPRPRPRHSRRPDQMPSRNCARGSHLRGRFGVRSGLFQHKSKLSHPRRDGSGHNRGGDAGPLGDLSMPQPVEVTELNEAALVGSQSLERLRYVSRPSRPALGRPNCAGRSGRPVRTRTRVSAWQAGNSPQREGHGCSRSVKGSVWGAA